MKYVPCPDGVRIIGKSFSGVRTGAARNEHYHEKGVDWATLNLIDASQVAKDMENLETGSIGFPGRWLPS